MDHSKTGEQIRRWKLPVMANHHLGGLYRELVLQAGELAAFTRPGQFVNVQCAEGTDPFLRRPLSVCRIDRSRGTMNLLYEIVGRGTALMAEWQAGHIADVLGPLGNWFTVPAGSGALALVAGGIGVAPLVALAEEVAPTGRAMQAILGARTATLLLREQELRDLGVPAAVATDDGSRGHAGFVSELLDSMLEGRSGEEPRRFDAIFSCGPRLMMAAVARIARGAGIPCFVSMETGMACGFGVCMGCACRVTSPAGAPAGVPAYRLVCTEGPIFPAEEIAWDES